MIIDFSKVTEALLLELDESPASKCGKHKGVVWMRWDYLYMSGMCYNSDRNLYDYLEKVSEVKKKMEDEGHKFNCDKWYLGEEE